MTLSLEQMGRESEWKEEVEARINVQYILNQTQYKSYYILQFLVVKTKSMVKSM